MAMQPEVIVNNITATKLFNSGNSPNIGARKSCTKWKTGFKSIKKDLPVKSIGQKIGVIKNNKRAKLETIFWKSL